MSVSLLYAPMIALIVILSTKFIHSPEIEPLQGSVTIETGIIALILSASFSQTSAITGKRSINFSALSMAYASLSSSGQSLGSRGRSVGSIIDLDTPYLGFQAVVCHTA
jgi:hypothetical protein